jgi:hypothetical protein
LIKKKRAEILILFILIVYSIYCSLIVGKSWDEEYHYLQGKSIFQYLLSFGKIRKEFFYEEYYSSSYWFFQFFFSQLFPAIYKVEVNHIFNLLISLSAIFGFSKLVSEFFNKSLGKIFFLILFFYPIFFGHMGMNPKDTVVTACHVWIFYFVIRYLRYQSNVAKSSKYMFLTGIALAVGTGVQFLFFGTLIPVLFFVFFEIFFFKKIIKKNFSYKLLLINFLKTFVIFYFFLIFFWPASHSNIILSPIKIFFKSLNIARGYAFNMVNGEILLSKDVSIFYFYINFFYKSPEFVLFTYLIFLIFILYFFVFFKKEFSNFIYKFLFLNLFLFMPILVIKLTSFGIYDGLRLFLWCLPYFLIIPSLIIYFLIKNLKKKIFKIIFGINFLLFIIYFSIFIAVTPYHYTYLNIFSHFGLNSSEKFEGDYWNVSIKELAKKIDLEKFDKIDLITCGVHRDNVKKNLYVYQKKNMNKIHFVKKSNAKYVLMANRVVNDDGNNPNALKIDTCFNKYIGTDVVSVIRTGRKLSVIRLLKTSAK